jgi:hypothetical protein
MSPKKLSELANRLRNNLLNIYAKEVRTPKYKKRVVKSKKIYNRKKHNDDDWSGIV